MKNKDKSIGYKNRLYLKKTKEDAEKTNLNGVQGTWPTCPTLGTPLKPRVSLSTHLK